MKIRRKLSIYLIIIIFTVLLVNTLVTNTNDHIIKGNINIWVEDKYYSYFTSTAKEFEENNKKVSIKVVSVKQEDYLYKILNTVPNELPSIVHLNFKELNSVIDKIEFTNENKQIIETYNKNFNNSRLEEVQIKDNYYAVPFTSNPIALYLRSDILKKFGYKAEDINSWERLIEIGKDIYTKSNGDINIFSSQDKENIRLLLAAQLVDYEEKSYENNQINDIINSIYNESFINDSNYICRIASIDFYKLAAQLVDYEEKSYENNQINDIINSIYNESFINDSNYICRIASIDFYKDLINNSIDGIWECKNPPSLNIGENKFYDIGGENLVALNIENNKEAIKSFISYASTNKELLSKEMLECNFVPSSLYSLRTKNINLNIENNKEAIKSFISYASTNKELLSKEMLECNFVPSSLYSLRTKNINKEGTKVQGSSPFLILSNIVEKAPEIKSYDKFNEIIYNVYN